MSRATKGCGCAGAVLVLLLIPAGYIGWKYVVPWWKTTPPTASGKELQVHILDVGPVEGDSILITSPTGKSVLIDAGDTNKGKVVLEALKRYNVQQLDYFIATHPHPDHIGGADEVIKATKVLRVIDNGTEPDVPESLAVKQNPKAAQNDIGGGAQLTVLAPTEPMFTRDQMKTGGNLPNANSIVLRLDYGDFSMLLTGDAEEQTEHRMLTKDVNLRAKILKVSHHGSKYATAQDFVDRVKPEVAIISCGEWNRYGHPAQVVLDRLKAANAKVFRTDLQGEITITSRGKENDYVIKTAKEGAVDVWAGRTAQKDDSTRSGFIAYGDFGPPPKKSGK